MWVVFISSWIKYFSLLKNRSQGELDTLFHFKWNFELKTPVLCHASYLWQEKDKHQESRRRQTAGETEYLFKNNDWDRCCLAMHPFYLKFYTLVMPNYLLLPSHKRFGGERETEADCPPHKGEVVFKQAKKKKKAINHWTQMEHCPL